MSHRIPHFLTTASFLPNFTRGIGAAEDPASPALSSQLLLFGVLYSSEVCSTYLCLVAASVVTYSEAFSAGDLLLRVSDCL